MCYVRAIWQILADLVRVWKDVGGAHDTLCKNGPDKSGMCKRIKDREPWGVLGF